MEKRFPPLLYFKGKGKNRGGRLEGADSSNVGTDSILVRIQVIQPPPLFPVHSSFLFVFSVLYFWLRWVFITVWASSSCGNRRPLCCPAACGIFPDQGSNPCPLHWQAESQALDHQGRDRHPLGLAFDESRSKSEKLS